MLKVEIDADLKEALLGGEKARVNTLRGLKSAILDAEVSSGKRADGLPDEEVEKVVAKEVKKRRESIEMYSASGRGDLVEEEETELKILEKYLPKQLSEDEINEKIDDVIAGLSEVSPASMGRVIGMVKMLVGNGADGMTVARLVKAKLGI